MSSPAQDGPSVPKEKEKEKKGFGKVLLRMKTVLKKADPSRRLSTLGSKSATTPAAVASTRYAPSTLALVPWAFARRRPPSVFMCLTP